MPLSSELANNDKSIVKYMLILYNFKRFLNE